MTDQETVTNEQRLEEAAIITGQNRNEIKTVQVQLDILKRQGILVDIDVSGSSMFTKSASLAEFGIQEDENDPRNGRLSKGGKYLLPEEYIKRHRSIISKTRQVLVKVAYKITGFMPWSYVPYTSYDHFVREIRRFSRELDELKFEILDKYDSLVDLLATDAAKMAEKDWTEITSHGYTWAIFEGRAYQHDEFIDRMVQAAVALMPSPDKIRKDLWIDYSTALVYSNADVVRDQEEIERIRMEREREREAIRTTRERNRLEEIEREEAIRSEINNHRIEEARRQAQIDEMMAAEAEHARERLHQIASPFEEVFTALRRQMAQKSEEILASIQKNGFVRGKVAEKGRGLVELFDLMAIQNDRELRDRLVQLRAQIGEDKTADGPERDTAAIIANLEAIKTLATTAADDLQTGPSKFSFAE